MRHDITKVIPGFTDLKKQPAILQQLAAYAKSMGYKDEEMKDIRDRRHLLMVYKAMKFDQMHQAVNE
jgi:hypothetical protein